MSIARTFLLPLRYLIMVLSFIASLHSKLQQLNKNKVVNEKAKTN